MAETKLRGGSGTDALDAGKTLLVLETVSDSDAARRARMKPETESIVQRPLDACNARDVDALILTYADDAQQFECPSKLLPSGAAQIRQRFMVRFREPNLHARLIHRIAVGDVVIDQEEVSRTFPESRDSIELVTVYELRRLLPDAGNFAG